jgi:hypothetical protein
MKLLTTLTLTGKPYIVGGLYSEKLFDPFMALANNASTRMKSSLHNAPEPASTGQYSIAHMHKSFAY